MNDSPPQIAAVRGSRFDTRLPRLGTARPRTSALPSAVVALAAHGSSTSTGTKLSLVVPSPSWPLKLFPQQ